MSNEKIPKFITDRVETNSENLGVNACLWVLEPSMKEYNDIIESLCNQHIKNMVAGFKWPEMQ